MPAPRRLPPGEEAASAAGPSADDSARQGSADGSSRAGAEPPEDPQKQAEEEADAVIADMWQSLKAQLKKELPAEQVRAAAHGAKWARMLGCGAWLGSLLGGGVVGACLCVGWRDGARRGRGAGPHKPKRSAAA